MRNRGNNGRTINKSPTPSIEGWVGHTLLNIVRVISITQSHKGVDFKAIGTVTTDHLPNSHSVDIGCHTVAVVSEG